MLIPFDFAIMTIEDANRIYKFIIKMTDKKGQVNHKKIEEEGLTDLFNKVSRFIEGRDQWIYTLENLSTSDFEPRRNDY